MSEPSKPPARPVPREERLAAALRQNLKRRKAQARMQRAQREADPGAAKEADKDKSPLR